MFSLTSIHQGEASLDMNPYGFAFDHLKVAKKLHELAEGIERGDGKIVVVDLTLSHAFDTKNFNQNTLTVNFVERLDG
jgi:hypothetical protein